MRLLILLTCLFISCSPVASGQGLPNSAGSGTTQTPICSSYSSSSGKVDIAVPSTDCIDIASNACGVACAASTSIQIANNNVINFSNAVTVGRDNSAFLNVNGGNGLNVANDVLGRSFSTNGASAGQTGIYLSSAASGNDAFRMTVAGARINLNNGSDYASDSSGVWTFNANTSAPGLTLTPSANTVGLSLPSNGRIDFAGGALGVGGSRIVYYDGSAAFVASFPNITLGGSANNLQVQSVAAGSVPTIVAQGSSDANVGLKLSVKGNQAVGLPAVANASLPTCTASTYSNTQVPAGYVAYDSTNNSLAVCNGTAWVDISTTGNTDVPISFYTAQTTGSGLLNSITMTSAGTFKSAQFGTDVTGVGAGNFVVKVCTDGATCAAGNTAWTCTMACTSSADAITSCTQGAKTTWGAGAVISMSIATACATTNQVGGLMLGNTEP